MCRFDRLQGPARVRSRRLWAGEDIGAWLTYYPPGLVQPKHDHDCAQLSFLLTGSFEEQGDVGEATPVGSRHAYKPAGANHAVDFGRQGALIFSMEFRATADPALAVSGWQPSSEVVPDLARLLLLRLADPAEAAASLVAAAEPGIAKAGATAPSWLRRSIIHLMDDPAADIAAVADDAGVHRVHLARECQRHFGLSPTHIRLHAKLNRALHLMIDHGARPCEAAVGAGFADQAHWTRASRAMIGISPARLRALLAA